MGKTSGDHNKQSFVDLPDGTSARQVTGNAGSTPITGIPAEADTPDITRVTASTSSVLIKAANTNRLELILFNDSNKDAFVKYGTTATSTSFTALMPPSSHYFIDLARYTGRVDAIWKTGVSGAMQITELT